MSCRGSADRKVRVQHDMPNRGFRALHALGQQSHSLPTHFQFGLRNRGERRIAVLHKLNVVKPNNRYVIRAA